MEKVIKSVGFKMMAQLLVLAAVIFSLANGQTRKMSYAVNPGCKDPCSALLVHIRADGSNDTIHHIWDFTRGTPTVLLAATQPEDALTINWTQFLSSGGPNSIQFDSSPSYVFAVALSKIIEFDDVDNWGYFNPDTKHNVTEISGNDLKWKMTSINNGTDYVDAIFTSFNKDMGLSSLRLRAFGDKDHTEDKPHIFHTGNSSVFEIVLKNMTTHYNNSRFAVNVLLYSSNSVETPRQFKISTTDDEHAPGVFSTGEIYTAKEFSGYLQWKTIAYNTPDNVNTQSTSVTDLKATVIDKPWTAFNASIIQALVGYDLSLTPSHSVIFSFGAPDDGFYSKHSYTSFSFAVGVGEPAEEDFSFLAQLLLVLGIITVGLLCTVGIVFFFVKSIDPSACFEFLGLPSSMTEADYLLAVKLQEQLDRSSPGKSNTAKIQEDETSSIVSPSWELIDPNPDIYNLFQVFNERFFWGALNAVEVKWSSRMTSCAGICTYKGRFAGCVISLSLPLLKLRSRKDLVETLLHEMIHAYLFVTDNDSDRSDHGPEFHRHMYRINDSAGTNITVFHTFHDEVDVYKTHWWLCNGPCRYSPPYYGLVKRSMNRAPGIYDRWFKEHLVGCGGTFIKIKEPEKRPKKKPNWPSGMKDITNYFPKLNDSQNASPSKEMLKDVTPLKAPSSSVSGAVSQAIPKTNIHGFSTGSLIGSSAGDGAVNAGRIGAGLESNRGGPLVLNRRQTDIHASGSVQGSPLKPFSTPGCVLGSSSTAASSSSSTFPHSSSSLVPSTSVVDLFESDNDLSISTFSGNTEILPLGGSSKDCNCPVCGESLPVERINAHLDNCLETSSAILEFKPADDATALPQILCPYCRKPVLENTIESHSLACRETVGLCAADFTDDFW